MAHLGKSQKQPLLHSLVGPRPAVSQSIDPSGGRPNLYVRWPSGLVLPADAIDYPRVSSMRRVRRRRYPGRGQLQRNLHVCLAVVGADVPIWFEVLAAYLVSGATVFRHRQVLPCNLTRLDRRKVKGAFSLH